MAEPADPSRRGRRSKSRPSLGRPPDRRRACTRGGGISRRNDRSNSKAWRGAPGSISSPISCRWRASKRRPTRARRAPAPMRRASGASARQRAFGGGEAGLVGAVRGRIARARAGLAGEEDALLDRRGERDAGCRRSPAARRNRRRARRCRCASRGSAAAGSRRAKLRAEQAVKFAQREIPGAPPRRRAPALRRVRRRNKPRSSGRPSGRK